MKDSIFKKGDFVKNDNYICIVTSGCSRESKDFKGVILASTSNELFYNRGTISRFNKLDFDKFNFNLKDFLESYIK